MNVAEVIFQTIEYLHANRDALIKATRGGRGRPSRQLAGVNAYQKELSEQYSDWADETADEIVAAADEADKKEVIDKRLELLLLLLLLLGRKRIPEAVALGLGDTPLSPEMAEELARALRENERYLAESLIPAIRLKLESALVDPDVQLALAAGDGEDVFFAVLTTLRARVESYSGMWWGAWNFSRGTALEDSGKSIYWKLDPAVEKHCRSCLEFGDRGYPSFRELLQYTGGVYPGHNTECRGNCRCSLEAAEME